MKLENRVKQILNELNIRINLKGYKYWVEVVTYVVEKNITSYRMINDIYTPIGKKHNDTASRVERALRNTYEDKKEDVQKYFGINYKIDNSALLALIVDKIETEMSEE